MTELAFGEQSEIKTESDLEDMEDDKRQIQCLLVTQRISMKYNCFPSNYVALKVYNFALKNWKTKHLEPSHVFYSCIYLIETIEAININKRKWFDIVFHELIEVLKDKIWNPMALCQQNTVLTFENLLKNLCFECAHLINAYNNRTYYQAHKLLFISDSILLPLYYFLLLPTPPKLFDANNIGIPCSKHNHQVKFHNSKGAYNQKLQGISVTIKNFISYFNNFTIRTLYMLDVTRILDVVDCMVNSMVSKSLSFKIFLQQKINYHFTYNIM